MKKINKPDIKQEDICKCFDDFKYQDRVIVKSKAYDQDFSNVKLFFADEKSFMTTNIDYSKYMKDTYKNRFSRKNSPSYQYYEKIRSTQRSCPYCNFPTRSVKELDHYLPKSQFPTFAVTSNNLVPICKDCNDIKEDYYDTEFSRMLIHPYYDNIEGVFDFLKCRIIENISIGFEFYIDKLSTWDGLFYERVRFHFDKLKIEDLYRSDFEAEFVVKFEEIKMLYEEESNADHVRESLNRRRKSLLNTMSRPWEYAGLTSIIESSWFFDYYLPIKVLGHL
ncbi:HNH endonuclease [Paenibacillus pedocola]|uniref:HNH endonuclease n=1 Tax=Paenibacillus pedocola TaxID=3242193 RepID=UPI00287780FB|nr:HNH endonuclease [Paenibacillus typhae]